MTSRHGFRQSNDVSGIGVPHGSIQGTGGIRGVTSCKYKQLRDEVVPNDQLLEGEARLGIPVAQ
jgi:hypothetical protein